MSDFRSWSVRKPSPGFAERVAKQARREHLARRRRRGGGAALAIGLALVAVVLVRGHLARFGPSTAIRSDEPNLAMPWPRAEGWDDLTLRFPLVFSPSITYRGGVHIHFNPEFDKPGTPGYWSFVNVWLTDADRTASPDPRRLEIDLRAYYTGLCGEHGHPWKHTRAPEWESRSASLTQVPLPPSERDLGRTAMFRGDVDALDCITNGGELSLRIEAVSGSCSDGTAYVAYAMSPRAFEDPVWVALRTERQAFVCAAR